MSDGLLAGRVAIVTGAGRGLGRAHCLELARHGATVVVNDLGVAVDGKPEESEDVAAGVAAEIAAGGGRASSDTTSVTDWDGMRDLVARTVDRYGRLDAVVNNAGIVRDRMITSLSEADFDAVMAVHVKGTFTLTKHACDHWRAVAKDGRDVTGRIVNTTSGAGLLGNVGQTPYGTAKAAIAAFTMIVAMEMDRYRVTANAVSPMAFTRMTATMSNLADYERPEREWTRLDPENTSPVVAWLASEESGWLTGAVLRIAGNTLQRMRPWEIDHSSEYTACSGERLDAAEVGPALRRMFGTLPRGIPGQSQ